VVNQNDVLFVAADGPLNLHGGWQDFSFCPCAQLLHGGYQDILFCHMANLANLTRKNIKNIF